MRLASEFFKSKIFKWVGALILGVGAVALVRDTIYHGQDFAVFWRTARAVWAGESAYSIAREGAMVFKYPPWIVPLFFPFALLPLGLAKFFWGITQIISLAAVVKWALRYFKAPAVWLCVLMFWGIWAVHALDGQVMLPVLALALWGGAQTETAKNKNAAPFGFTLWVATVLALTTKIFTFFAALGLGAPRGGLKIKHAVGVLGVVAVLSAPVLYSGGNNGNPVALFNEWREAAASGGTLIAGNQVRNRENQGFPALILRLAQVPAQDSSKDVAVFLVLAFGAALYWRWASRGMARAVAWSGWLALTAAIHPLAWFHGFVAVFPLACAVVSAYWPKAGQRIQLLPAFFAVFMVTAVTHKTLGILGLALEGISIKAWGVLSLTELARRATCFGDQPGFGARDLG